MATPQYVEGPDYRYKKAKSAPIMAFSFETSQLAHQLSSRPGRFAMLLSPQNDNNLSI